MGSARRAAWLLVAVTLGAAAGPVRVRAQAAGDDHDIALSAGERAPVGERRALSVAVTPRPGFEISRDAPLIIDLRVEPAAGLALGKRRYRRADAADPQAAAPRFDLAYRGDAPGRYTVTAELRFWVCARRTCRPVHALREATIEITGEAPGEAPDQGTDEAPDPGPGEPPG